MSPEHEAAWKQLVADAKAFAIAHEGAEFVALLVWEAAVLGFTHGTLHAAGRSYDEQRADFPKDHAIVAGAMGYVTVDGVERFAALRELALADYRVKRAKAESAAQQPECKFGCDHGPGWQCVNCVSEGEFRFEPLGGEQQPDRESGH